ncbi:MAG: aminotransferase class V-fold PLP-dependent enzyme [Chloroflexi bacterium]|nr:aminotransferase class V-fold PLP-dependent enzyme [Chloroflexota bacterium]
MSLKLKDIALATGSACTSASVEPSHAIRALGFGDERAHSALRVSMGRFNTNEQIDKALSRIISAMRELLVLVPI